MLTKGIGVLLTMREGATTYSLVEYSHKEHVTVFEIRFHFINGLDPESERQTQTGLSQKLQWRRFRVWWLKKNTSA